MKYVATILGALLVFEGIWAMQDRNQLLAAALGSAFIVSAFITLAGKERP
jgi:hypothetical protein